MSVEIEQIPRKQRYQTTKYERGMKQLSVCLCGYVTVSLARIGKGIRGRRFSKRGMSCIVLQLYFSPHHPYLYSIEPCDAWYMQTFGWNTNDCSNWSISWSSFVQYKCCQFPASVLLISSNSNCVRKLFRMAAIYVSQCILSKAGVKNRE